MKLVQVKYRVLFLFFNVNDSSNMHTCFKCVQTTQNRFYNSLSQKIKQCLCIIINPKNDEPCPKKAKVVQLTKRCQSQYFGSMTAFYLINLKNAIQQSTLKHSPYTPEIDHSNKFIENKDFIFYIFVNILIISYNNSKCIFIKESTRVEKTHRN